MSPIDALFGPPDPHAPVVVYEHGCLESTSARSRLVKTLRFELEAAELTGSREGLDDALSLLAEALDRPMLRPGILVVRGGERPVLWEVPSDDRSRHARLSVHETPPRWLEDHLRPDDQWAA